MLQITLFLTFPGNKIAVGTNFVQNLNETLKRLIWKNGKGVWIKCQAALLQWITCCIFLISKQLHMLWVLTVEVHGWGTSNELPIHRDYSGPRFLWEKKFHLDKNSERFSNSVRFFFFARSDKLSEIFFFFFFVKARFCIQNCMYKYYYCLFWNGL